MCSRLGTIVQTTRGCNEESELSKMTRSKKTPDFLRTNVFTVKSGMYAFSEYFKDARAFAFSLLLAVAIDSRADSPMEPPKVVNFCSENLVYCVHSTPVPARTVVYAKAAPDKILWSLDEYVWKGFLTDDGHAIASCYGGLNLLPMNATLDLVVARILHASGKVEQISLRSGFSSIKQLPPSSSHLEWHGCMGIEQDKLILERADGSRWLSDPL